MKQSLYYIRKNHHNRKYTRGVFFQGKGSWNDPGNKAWKMEYLISSKKKYVNVEPVLHLEYDADNLRESYTDSKCPFRGVDFASFHSRCFLSLRKRNSRNFFALTLFTVCTAFARGIRVSIFFIFSRKISRELKRSFDYAILRALQCTCARI